MSSAIQAQLTKLLEHESQLNTFLDNQEYDLFQEQQNLFSKKIKSILDNSSIESLNTVLEPLKALEIRVIALQRKSELHFNQLKEKSLLQKRNKNKLKAYKTIK